MTSLNDELKDFPQLRTHKNLDDGLRLPDHYFEELEHEIFKKLDAENCRRYASAPPTGAPALFRWWKGSSWQVRLAVAAAAMLLMAVVAWHLLPRPSLAAPHQITLSDEEVEAFLLAHPNELSWESLHGDGVENYLYTESALIEHHAEFLLDEDLENLFHTIASEDDD